MLAPRYSGIATFMRAPLLHDPHQIDIALIGVPYDGAVENRSGARHGPREVRNRSTEMRTIHHVTRTNPYNLCRIADIGDVPMTNPFSIEVSHREIMDFYNSLNAGDVTPLSIGGDHSITLPILRAIASDRPVGMIHIDAHTDTCDEEMGSKFSHGTPFRRAVEERLLNPNHVVQIGIRGSANSQECWDFSTRSGMRLIFMEEFTKLGIDAIINEARRVVDDHPVYLSFDIDSLDPAFAPGTGTPEVGGMTTIEAQTLLRGLHGLDFIGGDLVEVAPPFDPLGNTALVAATLMYEMLCLMAESVVRRKH